MTEKYHLEPQTGIGLTIKKGQLLKIIDPRGEQVSDLTAFAFEDTAEWLSSGRTIDYANKIYLSTGDLLYSNRSRPMLSIVEDTVGRHDFLLTPCSPETFQIIYNNYEYHPSIKPDMIPTTLNVFMNVVVLETGELRIDPPPSKAGDYIIFRAEMDLILGITACSAEMSNNYSFKPIDVEIYDA